MTIDDLLAEISASPYHLAYLGDLSAMALPRWEARLHAPADSPDFLFLLKFGCGETPVAALTSAIAAQPTYSIRRSRYADEGTEVKADRPALTDLLGLSSKPIKRRV
jgi:hypothetical protein